MPNCSTLAAAALFVFVLDLIKVLVFVARACERM
jgi:hypothetical protein